MLTFYVPPGIGDFSAMYAKLSTINREMVIRSSGDEPNRLGPFLDILPKIKNGGYASHGANFVLDQTLPPHTDIASLDDGEYFLAINAWLEKGGRVADWIPGETDYHYDLHRQPDQVFPVGKFLDELPMSHGPLVGVYCSAYGNSRHWGFWGPEEWRSFLEMVQTILPPDTVYIFMGAEYDVQIADYLHAWVASIGLNSRSTLGSFHIGGTIRLIHNLDYFFVFPSGLGFLADVERTPHTMWFPPHLQPMMGSFCDPVQFESGRTHHALFATPEKAFEDFKQTGLKFIGG